MIVVLVPKLGKDPEICASYWPILLKNTDSNLLAKILSLQSLHLAKVMEELIRVDETGVHAWERNRH